MKVSLLVLSLLTVSFFTIGNCAAGQAVQVKPDPPRSSTRNPRPRIQPQDCRKASGSPSILTNT